MREFAHAIHPPVLSDQGLLEAIEAQAARLPLEVVIEADPALRGVRYPAHIETTTWYVVAEALTNAVKHARRNGCSSRSRSRTGTWPSRCATTAAASIPGRRGLGLAGLADRIAIVHGALRIDSQPGQGNHAARRDPCYAGGWAAGTGQVKTTARTGGCRTWLSRCASSSPTTTTWSGRAPGGCSRTRGEVTVLAAVGSAAELLDAVRRARPDAVLTDIRMPPRGQASGGGADGAPGRRWKASTRRTRSGRPTRTSAW